MPKKLSPLGWLNIIGAIATIALTLLQIWQASKVSTLERKNDFSDGPTWRTWAATQPALAGATP